MRNIIIALFMFALFSSSQAIAADKTKTVTTPSAAKTTKPAGAWTGFLVDNMCADSTDAKSDVNKFLSTYTKECALMDCCKASGFSIYSGGKWLKLDKKGNELAANVMSKSKKTNRIEVKADGNLEGKTIKVSSLTEVSTK
ncbi:MAG: hypothetical protein K2Q33_01550 [Gammaproteobacteria bacterium]|nr:hypothetical protein [Gammaproteobacteria bacterium]